MSSSNLAERMEHSATDQLSHPPRTASNDDRFAPRRRLRTSFTNRKSTFRDHGLRNFRVR
jgi:hypothetical protein